MGYTSHIYTKEDFLLLKQHGKKVYIKIQLLNDNLKPINELSGDVISGDIAITSSSLVRRTCNLSINLNKKNSYLLKDKTIWFNKLIKISIGFYSTRTKEIIYYNCGIYVFDSVSINVDGSNNKMDISCVDLMGNLDATHRGQILGKEKLIYKTGQNIREQLIGTVTNYAKLKNYYIDEIGTYYNVKEDNTIPHDIEFDGSKSVLDAITTLTQLYSFYETFIDVDGTFICQRMVTKEEEPVMITNELFSQFVISEKDAYPITEVYNTIELWGRSIDYDRFAKEGTVTLSGNQYNVTLDNMDAQIADNTLFGFKLPSTNPANATVMINNLGPYPILHPDGKQIDAGYLGYSVYIFKYIKQKLYLQGQFEVHAVSMLFNEMPKEEIKDKYRSEFKCDNIFFDVSPESNFSVEKIGVKATTKSSGEYDNITSDYLGLQRSKYELYKSAKFTDKLTLEMIYIPFLTVGVKVEYQPINETQPNQYIITDINTTISDGIVSTMTVSLYDTTYLLFYT
jgi:hypothetical protein